MTGSRLFKAGDWELALLYTKRSRNNDGKQAFQSRRLGAGAAEHSRRVKSGQ